MREAVGLTQVLFAEPDGHRDVAAFEQVKLHAPDAHATLTLPGLPCLA